MRALDGYEEVNFTAAGRDLMMIEPRILVAGVGNIFLGDDAFGSEVARVLLGRPQPPEVKVVDFGIRGFDLTYALLAEYELTILVDATPRGEPPGTLYIIEPNLDELDELSPQEAMVDTHNMNPLRVLAVAKSMGAKLKRILVVGCEPAPIDLDGEGEMGLSEPVQQTVISAVEKIESLIEQTLTGAANGTG